ncbi:MAG: DNA primase [Phycisphaerae bacterium]|nr:DNA primase [Phycisphaerae bacterium]
MDNSLKDKVLEAADIVEVIGERVALTRKGKDFIGLCPFHADHKPSMSVSPQKQIFKCWSCGAGGDVIRFVEMYERVDFKEALAALARRAGIEMRSSPADQRANEIRAELQAAVVWARRHFQENLRSSPAGRAAQEYALGRGLTPESIERHGLGFAPDDWRHLLTAARRTGLRDEVLQQAGLVITSEKGNTYDRFRNRLIFPISDVQGRPIAFGGRTLGDDPAKYLNSPETVLFSKSRVLYGFDLARRAIDAQRAVIVVEGYLDAVMLSKYGFENVVATLGTALTDAHAKLLRPRADTLYLCFDGDQAGIGAANRAVEVALRTQAEVRVVLLETGQDPADCVLGSGATGFQNYLNGAIDALEFKWSRTLSAFGQGGRQAKRVATEEYLQFVAGATLAGGVDPLQQNLLIGRLSEVLGVPPEEVFDLLAGARRSLRRGVAARADEQGGCSAYETSIRGLPAGLVTASETVFGLLVLDASCWQWVDETMARAAQYSETWQRLYGILLEVHKDVGEYSIGEVVSRCDDGAVCELVSRARARAAGVTALAEDFAAARETLASELSVLRVDGLQEDLRQSGGDDEDVFRLLHEDFREQHSALPVESRRSATSSA